MKKFTERPKLKRTISIGDINMLKQNTLSSLDMMYADKVLKPDEIKEIQYFNKFDLKREGKRLKF